MFKCMYWAFLGGSDGKPIPLTGVPVQAPYFSQLPQLTVHLLILFIQAGNIYRMPTDRSTWGPMIEMAHYVDLKNKE